MYTKFGCKIDRVYSYTNIPKENLKFSKGTEVLVPRVGEDPMDYNHCTWLSLANVAIGEMISVYNTEQNPLFTAIMFNATLKYEFAKRVEGGSVTNLYYEKLLEIPVSFPIIEEQKKIASFFENLDTLITLHQREYFSFDFGSQSAKIAQNTLSWEQRKVGDTYNVTRGYVLAAPKTSPIKTDEKPFPVYSSQTKDNGLMGYYNEYLYENAITWTTDGANAGTVNFRAGKFYCTNVCGVLLSDAGYSNKAAAEALNMVAWKWVSHVGNPKLMNNVMAEIGISLPPTVQEQEKISEFLTSLDHLITLHQHKPNKKDTTL